MILEFGRFEAPSFGFDDVLGEVEQVEQVLGDPDVLDVVKIPGCVPHFNVKQAGIQSPGKT